MNSVALSSAGLARAILAFGRGGRSSGGAAVAPPISLEIDDDVAGDLAALLGLVGLDDPVEREPRADLVDQAPASTSRTTSRAASSFARAGMV